LFFLVSHHCKGRTIKKIRKIHRRRTEHFVNIEAFSFKKKLLQQCLIGLELWQRPKRSSLFSDEWEAIYLEFEYVLIIKKKKKISLQQVMSASCK